jgi:hypothetical protein
MLGRSCGRRATSGLPLQRCLELGVSLQDEQSPLRAYHESGALPGGND